MRPLKKNKIGLPTSKHCSTKSNIQLKHRVRRVKRLSLNHCAFLQEPCHLLLLSLSHCAFLQEACLLAETLLSCRNHFFLQKPFLHAGTVSSCRNRVFLQEPCLLAGTLSSTIVLLFSQSQRAFLLEPCLLLLWHLIQTNCFSFCDVFFDV